MSREEVQDAVVTRVQTAINDFPEIETWIVVNEFIPLTSWHSDDLQLILGDYTEVAFEAAREANPEAVLILNNTGNETSYQYNYDRDLLVATRLHDLGLLDGMGLQMHIMISDSHIPAYDEILTTILRYKKAGIPVYITELDVNLERISGTDSELIQAGLDPSTVAQSANRRYLIQAKIYENILQAAFDSENVSMISFFSTTDDTNWYIDAFGWEDADSTLFDDNSNPKPAYYVLMEILLNRLLDKQNP
jgi:endo-1,4-beta-xylanase